MTTASQRALIDAAKELLKIIEQKRTAISAIEHEIAPLAAQIELLKSKINCLRADMAGFQSQYNELDSDFKKISDGKSLAEMKIGS